VTDDELRDLKERVQLIEEMVATPGWALLQDFAADTLDKRQQAILHGSPGDYTDYQRQIAFLDGAGFVLSLPHKAREGLEEELGYRAEVEEAEEVEAA
jgi:hypothetical protein